MEGKWRGWRWMRMGCATRMGMDDFYDLCLRNAAFLRVVMALTDDGPANGTRPQVIDVSPPRCFTRTCCTWLSRSPDVTCKCLQDGS